MTLTDYINRRNAVQAPAPVATPAEDQGTDVVVTDAWGISPLTWMGMTDQDRAWHRWNVAKAPHFNG